MIQDRLKLAGWTAPLASAAQHCLFLELMSKWNRKINLTSLQLEPLSIEAVDRLIVEPVLATSFVTRPDANVIDLGSGGGSPAIPIKIQLPALSLRMVESRSRKCAFLREAIRQLGLTDTVVEEVRFEDLLGKPELKQTADVITVRAVRFDEQLLELIQWLLIPGGEVLRFTREDEPPLPARLHVVALHHLVPSLSSKLQLIRLD